MKRAVVVFEKNKFLLTPLIFVFQAMYLPWVLFAFNMIIAGGGIMELIGILIGHMYFFLMFKYPQDFGGPSLLSTPQFMYNWFPNQGSQFKIPTVVRFILDVISFKRSNICKAKIGHQRVES